MSAVRAKDTALVQRLLDEDREPGMLDAAFGLAVRMHAGGLASLLLQYGADPDRCGPGELLSLREAVESGSPALVEALLDPRILGRCPASEFSQMRDLARHWHEVGAEAELRRRTGSQEAVVRTRVEDDEYYSVDEFTLGRMTVRDGHGAILTDLERLAGVRTAFEELMARALGHDEDHAMWGTATILLANRRDQETWSAAAALRTHAAPSHRLFGAQVLRLTHLFDDSDEDAFARPALDIFTDWSAGEEDLAVLIEVLVALGEHADPRADTALLAHAGHPDPRVRSAVARGVGTRSESPAFRDEVREALLVLMTDVDPAVRLNACLSIGEGKDRDTVLADALAALLDDTDRQVRIAAVHGLALHRDERCVEAANRLGPPQPDVPSEEHYLASAWRYERCRDHC
ncbi:MULTISPECIES: HEAT repeat domain-containing protein [unclassified Streptomyces]|uniref:HEAT repeat domain-containing protein n=1 Tax=unclassified Streptomyces TaxID=2593676 RepID=UPI0037FB257A